ncbi:MAG: hypothetical protein JNN07_17135 [Verrucomicrobiales bacterium]|nr:hypothetical protein [Verrucomicrobiales bacterium]
MNTPNFALCGWASLPCNWDFASRDDIQGLVDDKKAEQPPTPAATAGGLSPGEDPNALDQPGEDQPPPTVNAPRVRGWLPGWMAALAEIIH